MATKEVTVPHSLAPNEVQSRLENQLLAKLQSAFPDAEVGNLNQQWSNNTSGRYTCTVGGRKISGEMFIHPQTLRVTVSLPFGASMVIDVEATMRRVEGQLSSLLA